MDLRPGDRVGAFEILGDDSWGLPIRQVRRLPDVVRAVCQRRLEQLAPAEASPPPAQVKAGPPR